MLLLPHQVPSKAKFIGKAFGYLPVALKNIADMGTGDAKGFTGLGLAAVFSNKFLNGFYGFFFAHSGNVPKNSNKIKDFVERNNISINQALSPCHST